MGKLADNSPTRPALEGDKSADNADKAAASSVSALSARTSAPVVSGESDVREDNGGRPERGEKSQAVPGNSDRVVRPAVAARPLPAQVSNAVVRADNAAVPGAVTDNEAADKPSGDKKSADEPSADNAADNGPDKPGRRGEIAEGVRALMAIGETDPTVITARLSEALGRTVDRASVARIVRREQAKANNTREIVGQYL